MGKRQILPNKSFLLRTEKTDLRNITSCYTIVSPLWCCPPREVCVHIFQISRNNFLCNKFKISHTCFTRHFSLRTTLTFLIGLLGSAIVQKAVKLFITEMNFLTKGDKIGQVSLHSRGEHQFVLFYDQSLKDQTKFFQYLKPSYLGPCQKLQQDQIYF